MSKSAKNYKVRLRTDGYKEPEVIPLLDAYYTDSSKSQQRKALINNTNPKPDTQIEKKEEKGN
jgi:hypothetical protein